MEHWGRLLALLAFAISIAVAAPVPGGTGFSMAMIDSYNIIARSNQSITYAATAQGFPGPAVEVSVLSGSRFQMGYDYSVMSYKSVIENYNSLLSNLLSGKGVEGLLEREVLEEFLDFCWRNHLKKETPAQYMAEIAGLSAGSTDAKAPADVGKILTRILVIANFPSDGDDLVFLLIDEFLHIDPHPPAVEARARSALAAVRWGHSCSMWAAWGPRVADGTLTGGRNLDWTKDTGVNKHKAVIVFRPDDGGLAHAVVGFAGMFGALLGMSSAGLTVTEANLEEKFNTFDGFPWLIRLRWVMENAKTVAEAQALFRGSNNTVGFNHMVAALGDVGKPGVQPAMAFETQAGYTAYLTSGDPREAGATWTNPSTNKTEQIGFSLPNALYRTNHGYDPISREYYMWDLGGGAGLDSLQRYMLIYSALSSSAPLADIQAVNISSVAGAKAHPPQAMCDPAKYKHGINVISGAFMPNTMTLWASWEMGTGSTWVPAACAWYLGFDLKKFF